MTPKLQRLHDALQTTLGGRIASLTEALGELTLVVKADDYHAAAGGNRGAVWGGVGAKTWANRGQALAGSPRLHHLHGAASEAEGHRPKRTGARPVDDLVGGRRDEPFLEDAFYSHSRAPFIHS